MSDKSGLSSIRRKEAIWGYLPILGTRDVNGPLIGAGKTTSVVGGFPEAWVGYSGEFRGGGCSKQVFRGRVPGEESTGVVCEDSSGGKSPGEDLNSCFNNIYWIVIIIM